MEEEYETLKESSRSFYSGIGKIFSLALNAPIHFTSEGFNHIIYKQTHSERDRSVQIMRFKLLDRAKKLVELATTYQEYEETLKECEVKSFKRKERRAQVVRYWGLIAIIDNRKIKVIIRKIGENGNCHFWSIVPSWVTNMYRDNKLVTTMKGDPEVD